MNKARTKTMNDFISTSKLFTQRKNMPTNDTKWYEIFFFAYFVYFVGTIIYLTFTT